MAARAPRPIPRRAPRPRAVRRPHLAPPSLHGCRPSPRRHRWGRFGAARCGGAARPPVLPLGAPHYGHPRQGRRGLLACGRRHHAGMAAAS
eukprot:14100442-Alexandrium_andersonii.AAC.1